MQLPDAFNPSPDGSDRLEEGFYLVTMHRAGRVSVPVRIWFGPPCDPETRDRPFRDRALLDRSWRWQVEINGILADDPDNPAFISGRPIESLEGIWPECRRNPIDETEYRYRVARAEHAELYDANDPFAGTGARVDPMTSTLPFLER